MDANTWSRNVRPALPGSRTTSACPEILKVQHVVLQKGSCGADGNQRSMGKRFACNHVRRPTFTMPMSIRCGRSLLDGLRIGDRTFTTMTGTEAGNETRSGKNHPVCRLIRSEQSFLIPIPSPISIRQTRRRCAALVIQPVGQFRRLDPVADPFKQRTP
jgi:hypothetical protein